MQTPLKLGPSAASPDQKLRPRLFAAALALSINGILLGALMLSDRADAEPSTPPAVVENQPSAAAEIAKPTQAKPAEPGADAKPAEPKRKRSGLRKLLPVRDFGGY